MEVQVLRSAGWTIGQIAEHLVELEARCPDEVVVEATWTLAVVSYARCFRADAFDGGLTREDVSAARDGEEVLPWHTALLQLRDRFADPPGTPGRTSRWASRTTSSARRGVWPSPRPGIRWSMRSRCARRGRSRSPRALRHDRIAPHQAVMFEEVKGLSGADLEGLVLLEVAVPGDPQ